MNKAIREKLEKFNTNLFTKKDGSWHSISREEELPLLLALPSTLHEVAVWNVNVNENLERDDGTV